MTGSAARARAGAGSEVAPSAESPAPAPPPEAAALFADRLDLAVRFADLLCSMGVERGVLGPREAARIWERHLVNSALLASAIPPDVEVVDLGSGAGLPGIPIWLARPDLSVVLLEPLARRVDFLREVVERLALPIEVRHGRAEQQPRGVTDVVVARAVAPLPRLLPLALPLLRPRGLLLALKGRSAEAEITSVTGIMRRWPGARISMETLREGAVTATVVRVDRGDVRPRTGAGRT